MDCRFWELLDYPTYCLADKPSSLDNEAARNVAKCVICDMVQGKSLVFDSVDPISVIHFLSVFELACDMNGVRERAALWL